MPLVFSFQKKKKKRKKEKKRNGWCAGPCQSLFQYDTDYRFLMCTFQDHMVQLVLYQRRIDRPHPPLQSMSCQQNPSFCMPMIKIFKNVFLQHMSYIHNQCVRDYGHLTPCRWLTQYQNRWHLANILDICITGTRSSHPSTGISKMKFVYCSLCMVLALTRWDDIKVTFSYMIDSILPYFI